MKHWTMLSRKVTSIQMNWKHNSILNLDNLKRNTNRKYSCIVIHPIKFRNSTSWFNKSLISLSLESMSRIKSWEGSWNRSMKWIGHMVITPPTWYRNMREILLNRLCFRMKWRIIILRILMRWNKPTTKH